MDASPALPPFHLFDPGADLTIVERRLPHWSQSGAVAFISWRTTDSMPKTVLDWWHDDRRRWLRDRGINPDDVSWQEQLRRLDPRRARHFLDTLWTRWHDALDAGHGDCVLRNPELARIVAESLYHFDGDRYVLFDFVVMPNHAHVLASFPDEAGMLAQCESWKHYTATRINRALKRRGRFWQQDAFDHLVRSEAQFEYLRDYIAANPAKSRLRPGEYAHYSRRLPHAEREVYDQQPRAGRQEPTIGP